MASYGLPPLPVFPRSKHTTPTRKTPAVDTSSYSPLSGFASPSSASSNMSFSPPSASYLSLASAAATTPLSSVDGADNDCASTPSRTPSDNRDQHEPLLGGSSNSNSPIVDQPVSPRSQNRQVAPLHSAPWPVDAVATTTAPIAKTMAQLTTPIRGPGAARDKAPEQNNTRSRESSICNNSALDTTLLNFTPLDAATLGCETSDSSLAAAASAKNASNRPATQSRATARRLDCSKYADASPVRTTAATSPWSSSQPITSDLIRRVSSSRSIAGSTTSPSSPTSITTAIVQPKATRLPSPHHQQPPALPWSSYSLSTAPPRQPFSSSVAQLEETAEQFSRTGSIESAIREAHQELKRSDSRRSSILAAYVRQTASQTVSRSTSRAASVSDRSDAYPADFVSLSRQSSLAQSRRNFSRQSSIIGLNSVARAGTLMPNDYIMSSPSSVIGGNRQRSASKASSAGSASVVLADRPAPGDETVSALSRHGSVRSVQSGNQQLPGIVEFEPPMTITQDALDEADRRIANGDDREDDDAIRARAHQDVKGDTDQIHFGDFAYSSSPDTDAELLTSQSPLPTARPSVTDYLGFSSTPQYAPVSTAHPEDEHRDMAEQGYALEHEADSPEHAAEIQRPSSAGSGGTYQQAQTAFHDFDGVHCDPDNASIRNPRAADAASRAMPRPQFNNPVYAQQRPVDAAHVPPAARPKSYLDPATGQQMLYYPARVPAMLSLPPKLSKNPKSAVRNARRSQVLSMMQMNSEPKPERESRVWLPDPVSGDMGSPFMNPLEAPEASGSRQGDGSQSTSKVSLAIDTEAAAAADGESGPMTGSTGRGDTRGDTSHLRRPSRILDTDKHKSRMAALNKLPPQLRASAFFDAPALAATANIELKNGSATDTLESILDASANAPVSAFTDHAFAGHLGPEVYGVGKRRPKKATAGAAKARKSTVMSQPQPEDGQPTLKSRSSFMSLVGLSHIRKVSETLDSDGRPIPRPRRRLSKNMDGAMLSPDLSDGGNLMAPDDAERRSDDEDEDDRGQGRAEDDNEEDGTEGEEGEDEDGEDEDEDDMVIEGAPTTLLAELQIRKRQQKLRTRPVIQPGGMRSTLLELDIVAEIERKARKGRKVNLAWEDPSNNGNDVSDDEDVPLGLLYAAKGAGPNALGIAELNRPLGLMEKKELEDNEPLSRRRDRLQGRSAGHNMYLRPTQSTNALRQRTMLTPSPSMMALNTRIPSNASNAHSVVGAEDADRKMDGSPVMEEFEDEPLGARRLRMKAKEESELPRARPVSTAFSEELLGQFVDPEEEAAKEREKKEKLAKANAQPSEEEETLGQRRRRLQAEKEARQQEMSGPSAGVGIGPGPSPATNNQALDSLTGSAATQTAGRLTRRLSMADVLAAHPVGSYGDQMAARAAQEREQRMAAEREQKMAALRAQMPQSAAYASANKSGGFLGGRFNDGSGGIAAQGRTSRATLAPQYGQAMGYHSTPNLLNRGVGVVGGVGGVGGVAMAPNGIYGGYGGMSQASLLGNGGMGMGGPAGPGYNGFNGMGVMPAAHMQMPMGLGRPMPMQVPMPIPGQPQIERVERWRQSIQP